MNADPNSETLRSRPTLPIMVPVLMALAVWAIALGHPASVPLSRPSPLQVDMDPVAMELRRFRSLADSLEQVQAIQRFGPIRDPRITVTLMESVQSEWEKYTAGKSDAVLMLVSYMVWQYHIPDSEKVYGAKYWTATRLWWDVHETEVRRQAAILPQ